MKIIAFVYLLKLINGLQFSIKPGKERCFLDDFYTHSVIKISYKVITQDEDEFKSLLSSIQIKFISDDEGNLIARHILDSFSGKYSLTVEKDGYYQICTTNFIDSTLLKDKDVYFELKIDSDSETNPDELKDALRKSDIDGITKKINSIVNKAQKIIQKQHYENKNEDISYLNQKSYSKSFLILTAIQVAIVLFICVYNFSQLKDFLRNKNIIE